MKNGEWRMGNAEWRMQNGEWRMKKDRIVKSDPSNKEFILFKCLIESAACNGNA
jgi:hypothetical protein